MSSDINSVFIIGRLTKDPELRYTKSGTAVCSFNIANNRTYKDGDQKKEQVSFFNCIAWAKAGELISDYCKKGQRIGIEGKLQQRSWEDQEGKKRQSVEIVVDNFQFLSAKSDEKKDGYKPNDSDVPDNPFNDDDIPF